MIFTQTHFSNKLNTLKGTVTEYSNLGPILMVDVNVGLPFQAAVTKRGFMEMCLRRGKQVWLCFSPDSVRSLGSKYVL